MQIGKGNKIIGSEWKPLCIYHTIFENSLKNYAASLGSDISCTASSSTYCKRHHVLKNILKRIGIVYPGDTKQDKQVQVNLLRYYGLNSYTYLCGDDDLCKLIVIEELKPEADLAKRKLEFEKNKFPYEKYIGHLLNFYIYILVNVEQLKQRLYQIKTPFMRYLRIQGTRLEYIMKHINYSVYYNVCTLATDYKNIVQKITNRMSKIHVIYSTDADITANTSYQELEQLAMQPVKYDDEPNLPDINKRNLVSYKLFNYQQHTIYWLIHRELNEFGQEKKSGKNRCWMDMSWTEKDNLLYFSEIKLNGSNAKNYSNKINIYGGCLIDEVGLGKTVDITCLALMNKRIGEHPLYISSAATLIVCPNHLCGQWEQELKSTIIEKTNGTPKILKFFTKAHLKKHTYLDLLHADFVITSFNFLKNPAYFAIMNKPIRTFAKRYHGDFFTSCINFTNNHNLYEYLDALKRIAKEKEISLLSCTNALLYLIHWHRVVVDEFHMVNCEQRSRLQVYASLILLDSNYKWCVSGTPFDHKNTSFLSQIYFLNSFKTRMNLTSTHDVFGSENIKNFTQLYRRNDKQSIQHEFTLPPIKEQIIMLNFTDLERTMYDASATNNYNMMADIYLRQLCCHPNIANETTGALAQCQTLEDIEKSMVSYYKNETVNVYKKILKQNMKIEVIQEKLVGLGVDEINIDKTKPKDLDEEEQKLLAGNGVVNEITDDKPNDAEIFGNDLVYEFGEAIINGPNANQNDIQNDVTQNKIIKLQDRLITLMDEATELKKDYQSKKNRHSYFGNVMKRLKDKDLGDCGICLSKVPDDGAGVTNCGHIFCFECLKIAVGTNQKCPSCNTALELNSICKLKTKKKKEKKKKLSDKEKLINKIGTKLANLVYFLRESQEKTIIFSQWDNLLAIVGKMLDENNINYVFCKGNCYQRNKAIVKFHNAVKMQVILLSSANAASGSNLTKATQIIFLDPVYGEYQFRKDVEIQAIARAHRLGQTKPITLIRFIIKDTVEEMILQQNQNQNKEHGAELEQINNKLKQTKLNIKKKRKNTDIINTQADGRVNIDEFIALNDEHADE